MSSGSSSPPDPKRFDSFAASEIVQQWGWLSLVAGLVLTGIIVKVISAVQGSSAPTVTAYITQDQVYAEPILQEFSRQTGIKVRPIFDSEAVKTVAIANRLLAEKNRPQCDLYWGNEELRTRQLEAQQLFRPTNAWRTVGYRSRRLVIATNRLSLAEAPRSFLELTNSRWKGKVALAYPLFGTTATHFLALRQHWGDAAWTSWCRALQANHPFLVDGNSVVVNFVVRGDALVGMTDSDDIAAAQREGRPVVALPLFRESLLIPNTLAVIRRAPHPGPAQKLFEFLGQSDVLQTLIRVQALEGEDTHAVTQPTLQPNWSILLGDLQPATESLQTIFVR